VQDFERPCLLQAVEVRIIVALVDYGQSNEISTTRHVG